MAYFSDHNPIGGVDYKSYIDREIRISTTNALVDTYKDAYKNAKKSLILDVVKFFNIPYGQGEEILQLCNSSDESNQKMGVTMLLGSLKEQLKEEIIKEIFK